MRAVLLDLDGTLVDSFDLIVESFHAATARVLGPRDAESFIGGIGTPLRTQFARYADDDATIDRLVSAYSEHYKVHAARAALFPGIAEALDALVARGLSLAVVTSKSALGTERSFAQLGLDRWCSAWVSASCVARAKPDPEPVHLALARLGVAAEDAIFVGDSPHDVRAGRAAGVLTAAVRWGPYPTAVLEAAGPDRWLDAPRALGALGTAAIRG